MAPGNAKLLGTQRNKFFDAVAAIRSSMQKQFSDAYHSAQAT